MFINHRIICSNLFNNGLLLSFSSLNITTKKKKHNLWISLNVRTMHLIKGLFSLFSSQRLRGTQLYRSRSHHYSLYSSFAVKKPPVLGLQNDIIILNHSTTSDNDQIKKNKKNVTSMTTIWKNGLFVHPCRAKRIVLADLA